MKMVTEPVPSDAHLLVELSSVATACLFSLVVALGDTGKILAAVAATLTAPPELSQHTLQVLDQINLRGKCITACVGYVPQYCVCGVDIYSSSSVQSLYRYS